MWSQDSSSTENVRISRGNVLVKLAAFYQNETLGELLHTLSVQIESIIFYSEGTEPARLGAASCFVFSSDPLVLFRELLLLLIG